MRRWLSLLSMAVLCVFSISSLGQTQRTEQKISSEIAEIATHAGLIFRGRVAGVMPEPARAAGEVSAMRVTFVVDDAIRGVAPGQMVTIRQWNFAPDEYRMGESLLLFLYAPSDAMGMTSPVSGRAGHRRPDEVPTQVLDSLRAPAVTESPVSILPRVLPKRPPRRLPRRMLDAPEVDQ